MSKFSTLSVNIYFQLGQDFVREESVFNGSRGASSAKLAVINAYMCDQL